MIISYQLSMQQSFYVVHADFGSLHRLFVDFVMWCICFILDGDVAHILYTVKSKQFNVLFSS